MPFLIEKLPESIMGNVMTLSRKKNCADVLAHCKQELLHAVWQILLDDDFIEAYKNGIVIKCYDGGCPACIPSHFYTREALTALAETLLDTQNSISTNYWIQGITKRGS